MRAGAAEGADAQLALGEVEIVVDDEQPFGRHLILCHQLLDRPAAGVHIGDGAGEDDLFAAEEGFRHRRLAFLFFELHPQLVGGLAHGEEAHVVEGGLVFFFGVAQPHDKIHSVDPFARPSQTDAFALA